MGCEMYGQSTWLSFGFWREKEKERQREALAALKPEHRELLMLLVDAAWRCYDWDGLWCPGWVYLKEKEPGRYAQVVKACLGFEGLSGEDISWWYDWIALGANKAHPTTYIGNGLVPHRMGTGIWSHGVRFYISFEEKYRAKIPPHDSEVISLLMVRAGLEWLEHLKSQGKL